TENIHVSFRRNSASCRCSFYFNATAPTASSTLSLHDALPISSSRGSGPPRASGTPGSCSGSAPRCRRVGERRSSRSSPRTILSRSEEHTSELQSRVDLVCRLLLEKKKKSLEYNICKHCSVDI